LRRLLAAGARFGESNALAAIHRGVDLLDDGSK